MFQSNARNWSKEPPTGIADPQAPNMLHLPWVRPGVGKSESLVNCILI